MRKLKDKLDQIDALLHKHSDSVPLLVHDRLIDYAERGVEAPTTLTSHEIRQVCFALIAHYSLMKIA